MACGSPETGTRMQVKWGLLDHLLDRTTFQLLHPNFLPKEAGKTPRQTLTVTVNRSLSRRPSVHTTNNSIKATAIS